MSASVLRLAPRLLAFALAITVVSGLSQPFVTPGRSKPSPAGPGAAVGYSLSNAALDQLGPVSYMDYSFSGPPRPGHRRLYFVALTDSLAEVVRAARANPGEWWTFGNEPNDPYQDNIPPAAYVHPYHDFYYALKHADPQARVLPTGIANADWRWLDAWREAYRSQYGRYPPVDGWRFHNYILDTCGAATNADEFMRRAIEFRDWTRRIGDKNLPVLLTEYGVLYGNGCCNCPLIPASQVIAYMRETTSWLDASGIVTGWMWFSLDSQNRFNGDLFSGPQILPAGEAYRELVQEAERK